MPTYRLYLVDQENHITRTPKVLASDSDEDAVERAKQIGDGHDVEVWQGTRLITIIKSKDAE